VADAGTAVEAGGAAGSNATGNVLTNDTDVDAGDGKTVSGVSFGSAAGTVGQARAGAFGSLTLNRTARTATQSTTPMRRCRRFGRRATR
jgi:hypothetical protein